MVLYTIMPLEYIFDETDDPDSHPGDGNGEMTLVQNGVTLLVQPLRNGQVKVNRILSTNAWDYLKPEWQPGTVMNTMRQ